MRSPSRLLLLGALSLASVILLAWSGWWAIDSLEQQARELEQERALQQLGQDLGEALGALKADPAAAPEPRLRWASPELSWKPEDRAALACRDDGLDALGDPRIARATDRWAAGCLLDALEALEPLLHHEEADLRALARGRAALIFAEAGKFSRAAQLVDGISADDGSRGTSEGIMRWLRCVSLRVCEPADWSRVEDELHSWRSDTESRATSAGEISLQLETLRALRGAGAITPQQGASEETLLRKRADWETWAAWLRESDSDPPPALTAGPLGVFVTSPSQGFRRIMGLRTWLGEWRGPEGETVEGAVAGAAAPGLSIVLAGGEHADLRPAGWTLVPSQVGPWQQSPRKWFAGGLSLYTLMVLAAWRSVWVAQRRAEQLAEARGELIAEVAHELRTPLTVLRMYAETLGQGRVEPEKRRGYLQRIAREAMRLGDVVDRVVSAAREQSTEVTEPCEPQDVGALLEELDHAFGTSVAQRGGTWDLRCGDFEHAQLHAGREQLRRLFEIPLENALRYGGEPPHIKLEVTSASDRWHWTVTDRGPGIAPAERERVLEPWYRGEAGRNSNTRGAGMGLYLSRRTARALGGDLHLEFPPQGGTIVHVEVPGGGGEA